MTNIPTSGGLGAALTVEDNAVERHAPQTAHQGGALPLRVDR
jgi:hypothetical protein